MIYPPSQKPPIWSIDPGVIAYNCQRAGMPHPVGAWPFWECGGNLARDYSGRGNHGTLTGGATWVPKGIDFNGSNGYIDCGGDIIGTGAYTKTIRFLRHDADIKSNLISGHNYTAFWAPDYYDHKLSAGHNGTWDSVVDSVAAAPNIWYSAAVTFDPDIGSGTMRLYKDGIEVDSATSVATQTQDTKTYIGSFQAGYFLNGLSDIPQIYNSALSAAQVKFIHHNPYFMYQIPEELYGYVAGAPPTGNPFWYYNMLRRRN